MRRAETISDIGEKPFNGTQHGVAIYWAFGSSTCNPVSTLTGDTAQNIYLVNNAINNTSGNNSSQGYQAGISDQGDWDVIQSNYICGLGYAPPGNGTAALFAVDVTATNNAKVQNNTICQATPQLTAGIANAIAAALTHAAKAAPVQERTPG